MVLTLAYTDSGVSREVATIINQVREEARTTGKPIKDVIALNGDLGKEYLS